MELFAQLGIDWRLLVAQIVNFLILMGALTFFLYKPIVATLEKRRTKIAESLENAERISAELKRVNEQVATMHSDARREAQRILTEANAQGEVVKHAATEKAKAEVVAIINAGKAQLAALRSEAMGELRAEAATLVVLATERVIGEKLTAAKDRALVTEAIEKV